jgi:hypothetical protein
MTLLSGIKWGRKLCVAHYLVVPAAWVDHRSLVTLNMDWLLVTTWATPSSGHMDLTSRRPSEPSEVYPPVHSVDHGDRKWGLPPLDIDIYRRSVGSLGHRVYHTNLYSNTGSHLHPSSKQAVLSTLVHRARGLCDQDNLHAELVFLRDVFRQNSYNDWQIQSPQLSSEHQSAWR